MYENNKATSKNNNDSRGIKMFCSNSGDHFSMFIIMKSFIAQKMSKAWCKSNNISYTNLMNCYNIAKQIYDVIISICNDSKNANDDILLKKYVKFDN